ncbi:hypothetical protein Tco_1226740, partial [Tanacetum coccineum]
VFELRCLSLILMGSKCNMTLMRHALYVRARCSPDCTYTDVSNGVGLSHILPSQSTYSIFVDTEDLGELNLPVVRLQAAELVREVFLETFSSYEVHTYGLLGYSIPKQEEMYIPFWKCSGRSRAEPAKYGTSRATLRSDMDYACGISDADCGASISPQIV